MSNIIGNILYISSYSSVEKLKEDKYLRGSKVVIVDEGDKIAFYKVSDKRVTEDDIETVNGFFATKVLTDNKTAGEEGSYTTEQPVKITVGGVQQGREFDRATYSEVFNAIFFPDVDIDFSIDLNLTSLFYLKGEEVRLNEVSVYNIQSEVIEYLELYIGDELVRRDEVGAQVESYSFLINKVITETTTIKVKLLTHNASLVRSDVITFGNPIYWGIVDKNFSMSSAAIQRLNRDVINGDRLEIEVNTQGTCVFLAVEANKDAYNVRDEGMNNILDNFTRGSVIMVLNNESYLYNTYISNVCSVSNFPLEFIFKEVVR